MERAVKLLPTREIRVSIVRTEERMLSHEPKRTDRRRSWIFNCGKLKMISTPPDQLFAGDGSFLQIATINAEIFVMAHENLRLRQLLETTTNTVDGRVLQWICMLLYPGRRIVLLKGANFVHDLAAFCRARGEKLFLLGSNQGSNAGAIAALQSFYPGLQVSGYAPPLEESPFKPPCCEIILERIKSYRPHHLAVCFGPAKQEFWIHENADRLAAFGYDAPMDWEARLIFSWCSGHELRHGCSLLGPSGCSGSSASPEHVFIEP